MTPAELLVQKIARARRFANAVSGVADRERFENMAAELQRELDALIAPPVIQADRMFG
jgi:hypothetical protein